MLEAPKVTCRHGAMNPFWLVSYEQTAPPASSQDVRVSPLCVPRSCEHCRLLHFLHLSPAVLLAPHSLGSSIRSRTPPLYIIAVDAWRVLIGHVAQPASVAAVKIDVLKVEGVNVARKIPSTSISMSKERLFLPRWRSQIPE